MTDSELIEHMHARGWRTEAIDVPMIREACKALQASASAEPVQEPDKWIFDPHDIEQGMMLNPAWLKLHGLTAREAIAASPPPVTAAREQEASATGAEPEVLHRMKYHPNIDGEGDWELFPLDTDECKECFEVLIIRATTTTSTAGKVDASRVRDEALEEAAKVCESYGADLSAECAREIRSLIGTPKSAEGEGA